MKGNIVATPAKKTAASSFADRIKPADKPDGGEVKPTEEEMQKHQEEKNNASMVEENKKDDSTEDNKEDAFSQNSEKDAAAPGDKTPNDLEAPTNDKVRKQEEGVDNQVDNDSNLSQFVNPDGVTFSGKVNPMNKTPDEISHETPAETAVRYGIETGVPEHISNNPNVTAHVDNQTYQIPGGTHVHPDIAKDNYNLSVGGHTENGSVTRTVTEMVFAEPAKIDDKGRGNFVIDPVNDSVPHENKGTVDTENLNAEKK